MGILVLEEPKLGQLSLTTLALRSVLLRVGPSEFALPASIAIEVSLTGFAGRLALPECPQPSWNRLSPWQASWLVVRTFVLFREESSGHTYCVRATGGNARHCYWSDPVVQLCVVKLPLTIRLSSRGQKYIFFLECDGSLSFCFCEEPPRSGKGISTRATLRIVISGGFRGIDVR